MFTIDTLPWLSVEREMNGFLTEIRVDSFTAAARSQHKNRLAFLISVLSYCRYPVLKNDFRSFLLGLLSCVSLFDIEKVNKKTKPARMLFCVTVKPAVLLVILGMISSGTINLNAIRFHMADNMDT